mmetsp:Transcript_5086/g.12488  ORF Transcript_5086/g.12488 Transcript_5086/m.12488 type:complete len:925 (+) Transcript_5086:320-3094(+)
MKNYLLIFQFVLLCQNVNIGAADVIADAKQKPILAGLQCSSRALPSAQDRSPTSTLIDDKNATDDYELEDLGDILDDSYPYCPEGYYCDLSNHQDADGSDYVLGLCKACSGSSDSCPSLPASDEGAEPLELILERAVATECQDQCGAEKNTCSMGKLCSNGLFCNFENGKDSGHCEECPIHMFYCENENRDEKLTDEGVFSCQASCDVQCNPPAALSITQEAIKSTGEGDTTFMDDVIVVFGSPQMKATGPIVDCGLGLEPCEGVEGSVCLIERGKAPFANKTRNCYEGGGVAAVIYNVVNNCENIEGTFNGVQTYIPTVALTHLDGKGLLEKSKAMSLESPLLATVDVGSGSLPDKCWLGCIKDKFGCGDTGLQCNNDNDVFGDCTAGLQDPSEFLPSCNDGETFNMQSLECPGESQYCDFQKGKRGVCLECPEKNTACFFSNLNAQGAKECAAVCNPGERNSGEQLKSAPCKFCPRGTHDIGDIADGFISVENEEEVDFEICEFCAKKSESQCTDERRWDMQYPNRKINMYGVDVECWKVAEFYESVTIDASSDVCQAARSFNHICGCSDTAGYAGANTKWKRVLLVWLPRVGGLLSVLGSSMMILNVIRDEHKRKRVIGELIIFLCSFDIVGSIAYALTTLPTPTEDLIYDAKGNKATCTAQGFFIQFGTISLYMNVSIAFYYLLIIQYSWRESRLRKSWVYPILFVVPILVGTIFAFAGIPFYSNTVLWCNNRGVYWPEMPVIIAIAMATFVMINLCWFVYKSERISRRFRRHSQTERNSLSKAFFVQSLVYLAAFYLTWPAYLALQMMIANGQAFGNYGFFLFAGTAVTLQGFWNFIFHTGLHTQTLRTKISRVWTSVRNVAASRSFMSTRSMNGRSRQMEGPVSQTPPSSNPSLDPSLNPCLNPSSIPSSTSSEVVGM